MKTDDKSMNEVRKLMQELFTLQDSLDILQSYNPTSYIYYINIHNFDKFPSKDIKIPMPKSIEKHVIAYINQRIDEIKQELKEI